jgi:hypothetical protein
VREGAVDGWFTGLADELACLEQVECADKQVEAKVTEHDAASQIHPAEEGRVTIAVSPEMRSDKNRLQRSPASKKLRKKTSTYSVWEVETFAGTPMPLTTIQNVMVYRLSSESKAPVGTSP